MAHTLRKWFSDLVKPHWEDTSRACNAANRNSNSSTTRHRGHPDRKEWNKKKCEKSALEDTISEINIKKFKIEASISAIVTNRSSGGSTIRSLGGKIQAGNAFGGRAEKAHIKKKWGIWYVAERLPWILFKLNICTNKYTHNKTHETKKGRNTSDIQSGRTLSQKMLTRQSCRKTLAGKNWAIIKYTDRSCDVASFSEKYTSFRKTSWLCQQLLGLRRQMVENKYESFMKHCICPT